MRHLSPIALGAFCLATACGPNLPGEEDELGVNEYDLHSACEPANVVLGIDIASYQHPNGAAINWATVAANRKFVIVKATEGTGYTNSYWAGDVAGARAHGLIAGSYHWLHYTTSGAAQAHYFLNAIGGHVPAGDLPPMLDVEEVNDTSTPAQRVAIMKDWLDTVEASIGRKPIIYSGSWYWASSSWMGTPTGFSDHPLAWAAYTSSCPQIPNDFSKLTIWQYLGGTGTTPGIQGACDQDKFYGTLAELQALANGAPSYAGTSLGVSGQSYPIASVGAVNVQVGQTVTGWVKLKNTGTKTWQPNVVKLAPIPRDQASPYHSASWLTTSRISTVPAAVAPGAVGQFELDITGKTVGTALLNLGWVAEGITWFADAPTGGGPADGYFAVKVNVVPAPAGLDAGVPMRPDASAPVGPDAAVSPGEDAGAVVEADAGEVVIDPDGGEVVVEPDGGGVVVDVDAGVPASSADASPATQADTGTHGGHEVTTAGCSCGSSPAGAGGTLPFFALLGLAFLGRRRR